MKGLQDKVAVVTGGGQGIGLAIGRELTAHGAHVVLADVNAETGEQAAEELGGSFQHLDVSDSTAVAGAAEQVVQRQGRVDVLVNNAGIVHGGASLELTDETWNKVIALDLTGVFVASREFGRYFVEQRSGAIVNISSISGVLGTNPEFHAAYDVAKAGVAQLARTLAVEWAPFNVRVNAVAPGRTKTPILDEVTSENPELEQQWLGQVPQARLFEPEEIADAVAFLASDSASAITGHTLLVDGGHTIS